MTILIIGTFLFYSLIMTGFRIKNFCLVESCIKTEPQDIPFWVLYLASVITFILRPGIGQWMILGFFALGLLTLFLTTIRFMIWPNEKKIKGYNQYFANTHHILKPSETRLIPDTFHLILLALVVINLTAIIVYIMNV
jgi:hypothetical protein